MVSGRDLYFRNWIRCTVVVFLTSIRKTLSTVSQALFWGPRRQQKEASIPVLQSLWMCQRMRQSSWVLGEERAEGGGDPNPGTRAREWWVTVPGVKRGKHAREREQPVQTLREQGARQLSVAISLSPTGRAEQALPLQHCLLYPMKENESSSSSQ